MDYVLEADLMKGQKTGIFLDQRENYLAVQRYARGGAPLTVSPRTGGFALHLAQRCEIGRSGGQFRIYSQNGTRPMRRWRNQLSNIGFTQRPMYSITSRAWVAGSPHLQTLIVVGSACLHQISLRR